MLLKVHDSIDADFTQKYQNVNLKLLEISCSEFDRETTTTRCLSTGIQYVGSCRTIRYCLRKTVLENGSLDSDTAMEGAESGRADS